MQYDNRLTSLIKLTAFKHPAPNVVKISDSISLSF